MHDNLLSRSSIRTQLSGPKRISKPLCLFTLKLQENESLYIFGEANLLLKPWTRTGITHIWFRYWSGDWANFRSQHAIAWILEQRCRGAEGMRVRWDEAPPLDVTNTSTGPGDAETNPLHQKVHAHQTDGRRSTWFQKQFCWWENWIWFPLPTKTLSAIKKNPAFMRWKPITSSCAVSSQTLHHSKRALAQKQLYSPTGYTLLSAA